mmetsp:Transcript_4388/g.17813  ORF Transcript_4388/g.17813 Transcript_4388/m.17813 type:complete len:105 (+) Transcript_4388:25-339(+)
MLPGPLAFDRRERPSTRRKAYGTLDEPRGSSSRRRPRTADDPRTSTRHNLLERPARRSEARVVFPAWGDPDDDDDALAERGRALLQLLFFDLERTVDARRYRRK